jgi:hypothetical protein
LSKRKQAEKRAKTWTENIKYTHEQKDQKNKNMDRKKSNTHMNKKTKRPKTWTEKNQVHI